MREQAQAQHAPAPRRLDRDVRVEELAADLELLGARGDLRAEAGLDVGERLAALRLEVRERVGVADLSVDADLGIDLRALSLHKM